MSLFGNIYPIVRDNWRVGLLVVLVALSTVFLFAPGFADVTAGEGATAQERQTNLKYGLELDGGTRIRAPLVGVTAERVTFGSADDPGQLTATVERDVASELADAEVTDVIVRVDRQTQNEGFEGTVEVTIDNVTTDQLADALSAAGYEFDSTRSGVTDETRQQTVQVLQSKINEAGLSGGTVQTVDTLGGRSFVLVEVPNADRSEVIDLVNSKGSVRVVAYFPTEQNGSTVYQNTTLIEQEQFQRISNAREADNTQGLGPRVPVRVTENAAPDVQQRFIETGIASPGGTRCTYTANPNGTDPCILLVADGEVVNAFGMQPSLADSMQTGQWSADPAFVLTTTNFSEAQQVAVDLRAGALPAPLDVGQGGSGTASFISPTQGDDFKINSLIVGIISVFAVSGAVFVRYGEAEVALPMIVTALSEVYALLGFAALLQFPLDLSVIGGFIAVIGTGVDDLIIIADEVMSEGEVNSRRVFQSRFRKAFWVIGVAAATTVIAMSPLAVLSLGDLQGFAIFTILGVLVGVLITRPAYGDILRALLTDK